MAASYPTSAKTFTTKATNDTIEAAHVNDLQDEVTAIENGLLSGTAHAVLPDSTANNRDLGSSSQVWRTLYAKRVVYSGLAEEPIITATGYSLTGSDASPLADLAGTWNTTGTPTGIKLDIVNTASGAGSLLLDLLISSVSKFKVNKLSQAFLSAAATGNPYVSFVRNSASSFIGVGDVDGILTGMSAGDMAVLAAGALAFGTNGNNLRWSINTSGHLIPASDNTYDIGNSTTGSVRNIFAQIVAVEDGTAVDPSLAFRSDLNNGFFLATTDAVGIATAGLARGRFHASGGFSWGDVTDPGATNVRVAGSLTSGALTATTGVFSGNLNIAGGTATGSWTFNQPVALSGSPKVAGGATFGPAAVASITVVGGIVTAIS